MITRHPNHAGIDTMRLNQDDQTLTGVVKNRFGWREVRLNGFVMATVWTEETATRLLASYKREALVIRNGRAMS